MTWWRVGGIWILLGAFWASTALAAGAGITYHGRLLKSDGTPVTSSSVQFQIQIRTPGSENCLMYQETQTKDLSSTSGVFSITINDGTATIPNSEPFTLSELFKNSGSFSFGAGKCSGGSLYNPSPTDGRKLAVSFNDGSGWETLPAQSINFVPMALESESVGGKTPSSFLRVDSSAESSNTTELTSANLTEFWKLIGGTSAQYLTTSSSGAALPSFSSNPSSPSTGSVWYDSTDNRIKFYDGSAVQTVGTSGGSVTGVTAGTGLLDGATPGGTIVTSGTLNVDVGTGADQIVQLDSSGHLPALNGSALTNLNASNIASGTIGNAVAVNTTGNIQTSGSVTSGAMSTRQLDLYDSDNSNKISLLTPVSTDLTTDYSLILPANDGTLGQVLSTNGSGTLSWISPSSGSVTSVTGTAPIQVDNTDATKPKISVDAASTTAKGVVQLASDGGTTAGTVVQADDSRLSAVSGKLSSTLSDGQIFVGNASNAATGVTPSGDVSISNAGATKVLAIQNAAVDATAPTASGQVLRYDSGTSKYIPAFLSMADIRSTSVPGNTILPSTACTASETLNWSSLTDTFTCQSIALTSASQLPSGVILDGGNTVTANMSIGANANYGLSFLTNSTSRMTIAAGGNVGIGTSTPAGTLDVQGGTAAASTDGTNINLVAQSAGSGGDNAGGTINITAGNPSGTGSAAIAGNVKITGGSGVTTAGGGGNVIIKGGTAASGNSAGNVTITGGTANNSHGGDVTVQGAAGSGSNHHGGALNLLTNTGGFNGNGGAINVTTATGGENGDGGAINITTGAGDTAANGGEIRITTGAGGSTSGNGGNILLLPGTATSGTPGYVGIGTTTPSEALEVNGNVKATAFIGDGSQLTGVTASGVSSGAGTAAAPSMNFSSDTDTGFYSSGTNEIGVSAGGSNIFNLSSLGLTSPTAGGGVVTTAAGTASAPTFSFSGDTDTGWYHPTADTLAAATGGIERVRIDASGNVGIETASPSYDLSFGGTADRTIGVEESNSIAPRSLTVQAGAPIAGTVNDSGGALILSSGGSTGIGQSNIQFKTASPGASGSSANLPTVKMTIDGYGDVGIGTSAPSHLFDVYSTNVVGTIFGLRNADTGGHSWSFMSAGHYSDAGSLSIKDDTAGKTRMSIDTSGNVGIGTTAPSSLLQVDGTLTLGGTALGKVVIKNTAGADRGILEDSGAVINLGSATGTNFPLTLSTNETERLRIDANGNVGIGMTTPSYLLDIGGATGSQIHVNSTTADDGGYIFGTNSRDLYLAGGASYDGTDWVAKATTASIISASSGGLGVWGDSGLTVGSTYTPTRLMTVTSAGNVGIGTANPITRLHVATDDSSGGNIVLQKHTNDGTTMAIFNRKARGTLAAPSIVQQQDTLSTWLGQGYDGSTWKTATQIISQVDGVPGADDMPGRITFRTTASGAGGANIERMRIDSNGNVGIGTTAPTAKLEVSGGVTKLQQEPWNYPTLGSSWVNYGTGYGSLGYRLDSQGYLRLRGMIKDGIVGVGNTIFTLPVGYRPTYSQEFNVSAGAGNGATANVIILSTGEVYVESTNASPVNWISFDNVSLPLD